MVRFNDFKPTFEVDYGTCYTFNYDTSVKYIQNDIDPALVSWTLLKL